MEEERVEEEVGGGQDATDSVRNAYSEDTLSDRSSIEQPYRAFLEDTSFARCHQTPFTACGADTYTRSLLMAGHGTPIWDPIGDTNRPTHHVKSGVMIGDVGYVTIRGDFESYFNIFLPPDRELQLHFPKDLEPLLPPLLPVEIKVEANYLPGFPPALFSRVRVRRLRVYGSRLYLNFTIKGRECGIFILPDGASRTDLLPQSTMRIRDYVRKHAFEWYKFLNGTNGYVICPNGSLCVVMGHDKAVSWASCTSNPARLAEEESVIVDGYKNGKFLSSSGMSFQLSDPDDGHETAAVFIRVMRFAVNIRDWTKWILSYRPPRTIPYYNMLRGPNIGIRARINNWKLKQFLPRRKAVQRGRPCIFHPLEVLLRLLLRESEISDVAILDDSMWLPFAEMANTDPMSQTWRLLIKALETHEVYTTDGLITLIPIEHEKAQEPLHLSPIKSILGLPSRLQTTYINLRRRREIIRRLSAVFPGVSLPSEMIYQVG